MKKVLLVSSLMLMCIPAFATTTMDSYSNSSHSDMVASTPQEDAAVSHTLAQLISQSKTLAPLNVTFTVNKGIVSYTGTVKSDSQMSSLVEMASSVIGVGDVNVDDLKVTNSEQPLSDTLITAKVKGLLIKEDLFGTKDLSSIKMEVETKNGVVYLTGVVDNKQQVKNAIDIIKKSVSGVKKVEYKVYYELPENTDNSSSNPSSSNSSN